MEDRTTKPFMFIDKKGQVNGDIHLSYGERKDDPKPFVLVVTPAYVASKTGKSPLNYRELLDYTNVYADELSRIAMNNRDRGYNHIVL